MNVKQVLFIFSCVFASTSIAQTRAAIHEENQNQQVITYNRIEKLKEVPSVVVDPFGDALKKEFSQSQSIIQDYCDKSSIIFVSQAEYLSSNTEQKRLIQNNPYYVVTDDPLKYIELHPLKVTT